MSIFKDKKPNVRLKDIEDMVKCEECGRLLDIADAKIVKVETWKGFDAYERGTSKGYNTKYYCSKHAPEYDLLALTRDREEDEWGPSYSRKPYIQKKIT